MEVQAKVKQLRNVYKAAKMVKALKIYFTMNEQIDNRRIAIITEDVVTEFVTLQQKILKLYRLSCFADDLIISWIDPEGDNIKITSSEELAQAVANAEGDLMRLYVSLKGCKANNSKKIIRRPANVHIPSVLHSQGPPPQVGRPFKLMVDESHDRLKEEFQVLQAKYDNLKLQCEKLATEKTEMHRRSLINYDMAYYLNAEMHKQTEVAKRLNAIISQILFFLPLDHQQQVTAAVERAKQVTLTELNSIIDMPVHVVSIPLMTSAAPMAGLQPSSSDMDAAIWNTLLEVALSSTSLEDEKRSSSGATPTPSTTSASSSTWICGSCWTRNATSAYKCQACEQPKPGLTSYNASSIKSTASGLAFETLPGATPAPSTTSASSSTWICGSCWTRNATSAYKCKACEQSKPGLTSYNASSIKSTANGLAFETLPGATPTPTSASSSTWICGSCWTRNATSAYKCKACEQPKPGLTSYNASSIESTANGLAFETLPGATPAPSTTSASSSTWICGSCWTRNATSAYKCKACEQSKPGLTSYNASSIKSTANGLAFETLPGATPAPSTTSASSSTWICGSCWTRNATSAYNCKACEQSKPGLTSYNASSIKSAANGLAFETLPGATPTPSTTSASSSTWICSCRTRNATSAYKCKACEQPKPGLTSYNASSIKSTASGFGSAFASSSTTWGCYSCYARNPNAQTKCLLCVAPKPGALASSSLSFTVTESGAPNPYACVWKCDECWFTNPLDKAKCMACKEPNPSKKESSDVAAHPAKENTRLRTQQAPSTSTRSQTKTPVASDQSTQVEASSSGNTETRTSLAESIPIDIGRNQIPTDAECVDEVVVDPENGTTQTQEQPNLLEDWTLLDADITSSRSKLDCGHTSCGGAVPKPTQKILYPNLVDPAPKPQENPNYIPSRDQYIRLAVMAMNEMGFTNEGGWLEELLISKKGNINQTLEFLYPTMH